MICGACGERIEAKNAPRDRVDERGVFAGLAWDYPGIIRLDASSWAHAACYWRARRRPR